jgi:hypothetical protein
MACQMRASQSSPAFRQFYDRQADRVAANWRQTIANWRGRAPALRWGSAACQPNSTRRRVQLFLQKPRMIAKLRAGSEGCESAGWPLPNSVLLPEACHVGRRHRSDCEAPADDAGRAAARHRHRDGRAPRRHSPRTSVTGQRGHPPGPPRPLEPAREMGHFRPRLLLARPPELPQNERGGSR